MDGFLQGLLRVSILLFGVTSMLSVGFAYTFQEVLAPLRNAGDVVRALVANFILTPLFALALIRLLSLEPPLAVGLFLMSCAAGAPFLIKLVNVADTNLARAATLLILLVPATVVFVPLVLPLVLAQPGMSGLAAGPVRATAIAGPLVATLLLPLGVGFLVRARAPGRAARLQPLMGKAATVSLVVLLSTTTLTNFNGIVGLLGSGAILAGLLLVLGAALLGYLSATPGHGRRTVLALGTGQRNIAASTVVATQSIAAPDTLALVVVTTLVGMAMLFPIAKGFQRRQQRLEGARPTGRRRWGDRFGAPATR